MKQNQLTKKVVFHFHSSECIYQLPNLNTLILQIKIINVIKVFQIVRLLKEKVKKPTLAGVLLHD